MVSRFALPALVAALALPAVAHAQTRPVEVEGLRLSALMCFRAQEDRPQQCERERFRFPQTGATEGRLVRLTDVERSTWLFRRADVVFAGAPKGRTDTPSMEVESGGALLSELDTGVVGAGIDFYSEVVEACGVLRGKPKPDGSGQLTRMWTRPICPAPEGDERP